jgi:hypothetical protein
VTEGAKLWRYLWVYHTINREMKSIYFTIRSLLSIIITLIILVSCRNQRIPLLNFEEGLKGRVKTISEFLPYYSESRDSGYIQIVFYKTSVLSSVKTVKSYNRFGNLISVSEFKPDKLIRKYSYEYIYDNRMKQLKCLTYEFDSIEEIRILNYNDKGLIVSNCLYSKTMDFIAGDTYSYDEFNYLKKHYSFSFDSILLKRVYYNYNRDRMLTERLRYHKNHSISEEKVSFIYEESGIDKYLIYSNDTLSEQIHVYKDTIYGKIEYETYNHDGEYRGSYIELHDEVGNVVQTIETNSNGAVKNETRYNYDEHGNWISKYRDNNLMPEVVRIIEYYR